MALGNITLPQTPIDSTVQEGLAQTNFTPILPYMVYQDDVSGLYHFKLILEVRLDSAAGTLLAKIKQRRNGYFPDLANKEARALFDIKDIMNDFLGPTVYDQNDSGTPPYRSIHTIGANTPAKPFSKSGDIKRGTFQICKYYVKAYQEYSEDRGVSPTENSTTNVDDTGYVTQIKRNLFMRRGGATAVQESSMTWALSSVQMFLSDVSVGQGFSGEQYLFGWNIRNYIKENDYHTLAFVNDSTTFTLTAGASRIYVEYYDETDTQIPVAVGQDDWLENEIATGGFPPSTVSTNSARLLYVGVGPKNLEEQSANVYLRPSAYSGWKYYRVKAANVSGASITTYSTYFIKDEECTKYKTRRLAWRNSYGAYDYYNFTMKNTESIEVSRENYNSLLGEFNETAYYYNGLDRGVNTSRVHAKVKETLQTNWILPGHQNPDSNSVASGYPVGYSQIMQSLFTSDEVYMIENSDTPHTIPVVVTNNTFQRKTRANDNTFQYTVNIEYANPLNTNS